MRKAVRLSDIAKRLGVSTVTVSNALADQKGVSEELRDRIKEVAAEMGYRTRAGLVVAEKKKTYNIGVMISEKYLGAAPSFYWVVYQALSVAARERNCVVAFEVLSHETEREKEMPLFVQENKVEGLIILGEVGRAYLENLKNVCHLPVVFLDFVKKDIETDAVIGDNMYGMYHLVDYLIKNGHRDIAYVGNIMVNNSIMDRYLGYLKAMLESGLPVLPEWRIDDRSMEGQIGGIILPSKMPTAFACNCDVVAVEVIKLLRQRGLRVPEDVSVVGFDNYVYEGISDAGITTYEVNIHEMVGVALSKLVRHIQEGDAYVHKTSIITGRVVVKESVRDIREDAGDSKNKVLKFTAK